MGVLRGRRRAREGGRSAVKPRDGIAVTLAGPVARCRHFPSARNNNTEMPAKNGTLFLFFRCLRRYLAIFFPI
jgi:hypothetical protein